MYSEAKQIEQIIGAAERILIIQADNPDADSLGSALALENILGELGKEPLLYCSVDVPTYLRYMPGWDRVNRDLPPDFDVSVIVDASTMTLFEKLTPTDRKKLASRPCIVLDHHMAVDNIIPFATVMINDAKRSSAGELIYVLAESFGWPLSLPAEELLMGSILGDTQGLTNQLTSAETYKIMAKFVEDGVDRPKLEETRRQSSRMAQEIFRYKGQLISRTEFVAEDKIAHVTVPQNEINSYSPLYNPAPLIQADMLQTDGVQLAIVFKSYADGKVTAAIRANAAAPVAASLAEHFSGGGHQFASGFKTTGRPLNEVRSECLAEAIRLLDTLEKGKPDETIQYADSSD